MRGNREFIMITIGSSISPLVAKLICILVVLIITLPAYFKKSLSLSGAVTAFVTGIVLSISGGGVFLVALFAFFIPSSLLTKFKEKDKKLIEEQIHDKNGKRDHVQVLANAGAALIIAVINLLHRDEVNVTAIFAAFAACNADTWASELGVLSKRKPFSILTFKPMEKGISGGVTFLGMAGALGGSLLVSIFYVVLRIGHLEAGSIALNGLLILLCGFAGSMVDSVLGAAVQPLYKNPGNGRLTEKKIIASVKTIKVKGLEFFSNDVVNFMSSCFSAGMIYLIMNL